MCGEHGKLTINIETINSYAIYIINIILFCNK